MTPLAMTPAGIIALSALGGCGKKAEVEVVAPPKAKVPARISEADLKKYKPNESGAIMVLMYHRINAKESDNNLNRRPDSFRRDLEMLHARGYYPVTVSELVGNTMDVPIGKTPIALTFDDALPTQFQLKVGADGALKIDRDCAVGILEKFHTQHPAWPAKATFFVLPKAGRNSDPFGQAEYVADKFTHLMKNGSEIANHTATHSNMHSMSADKVRWELATAARDIRAIAPAAAIQTMALPYGKLPRNEAARKALIEGQQGGTKYQHKAVFLAAWRPVLSPVTRPDKTLAQGGTFCVFDPFRLERITPNPRQAKLPGTFEYWMKYFAANPTQRYISDGNAQIVAVPAAQQSAIDAARVRAQGKTLQAYGGASKGSKTGGSLSVE